MLYMPNFVREKKRKVPENNILFQGFPLGLNTSVPPFQLSQGEMARCVDWKINSGGQLETRGAIVKYTTTGVSNSVYAVEAAVIGGTNRTIIAGSDSKIYYLNSKTATLIGTAAGKAYLFPYNNAMMVCDGSYLKFLSDVATLRLAYDAGEDGTQYDNYAGTNDSGIQIGNGTNVRAAVKFTSATWDAGFTMPLTQITCFLKRTNPGTALTGTITAKLRLVSDDSILATKDCSQSAGEISDEGEYVDFIFSTVTTEMSSATAYYATIEYTGGDASNYLELMCSANGTFTNTGYAYVATWAVDTGKNPIMKVYPGLPPKCSFGWVSKLRPWFAGDPSNPGYVWYGNLSYLDFSSGDDGGYISVGDDNKNSYIVGGGQDLYGEMFVYGTEAQPYLSRLEGTSPEDFKLPAMFQRSWTTQRGLKNVGNDLWNGSGTGVDALSGVQQYGDVRTYSTTDKVKDKINKYWSSTNSFAGYHPEDGHYWLALNHAAYSKILIGHTKQAYQTQTGVGYPWTEYDLPCTASAFGTSTLGFMIGATDGHLYHFDADEYLDLGTDQIAPFFRTAYVELPFKSVDLVQLQSMMSSIGGSDMTIAVYKNGNRQDPVYSYSYTLAMSDTLTIDDLLFNIDDWTGTLDADYAVSYFDININVRSFQVEYSAVDIIGHPVFFNGCVIRYRQLEA